MSRVVNLDMIETWLAKNGGVAELAHRSRVSPYTIMKLKNRRNPRPPSKRITQLLLAEAMGVPIDQLFPPIGKGEPESA